MYTDSRSDKGAYSLHTMDYVNGHSSYHLCKTCLRQLLTEFLRMYTPEDFDDEFGTTEEGGAE